MTNMITPILKSDTHILPTNLGLMSIGNVLPIWHEHDQMASYYILAYMTNMLHKQCEGMTTASSIILHSQEMFGEQSCTPWSTAIWRSSPLVIWWRGLQLKIMLMISYANELNKLEAWIGGKSKVTFILASLSDSCRQFVMMNKINVILSQLINILILAENLHEKKKLPL